MGGSIAVLYRLALERPELEMEASACHWSELFAYYLAATPRMSFSYQYILPTTSVERAGRVSKSVMTTTMFWLALAKLGHGVPS
jgi:hypothetical protein